MCPKGKTLTVGSSSANYRTSHSIRFCERIADLIGTRSPDRLRVDISSVREAIL